MPGQEHFEPVSHGLCVRPLRPGAPGPGQFSHPEWHPTGANNPARSIIVGLVQPAPSKPRLDRLPSRSLSGLSTASSGHVVDLGRGVHRAIPASIVRGGGPASANAAQPRHRLRQAPRLAQVLQRQRTLRQNPRGSPMFTPRRLIAAGNARPRQVAPDRDPEFLRTAVQTCGGARGRRAKRSDEIENHPIARAGRALGRVDRRGVRQVRQQPAVSSRPRTSESHPALSPAIHARTGSRSTATTRKSLH